MAASPHLCSTSGSLGPAANVAYNMSRLHPSSQRSKNMQNYSKTLFTAKLQTQCFASEICYYMSQSVVRDHCITIYSSSHPYIESCLLMQRAKFTTLTQLLSVHLHACLTSYFSIMLFKNTVCACIFLIELFYWCFYF